MVRHISLSKTLMYIIVKECISMREEGKEGGTDREELSTMLFF